MEQVWRGVAQADEGGWWLFLHLCTQLSKAVQTSFVRRGGQRARG